MSDWKSEDKNWGIRFQNSEEFNDFKKLSFFEKLDFACIANSLKIYFSLKNLNSIQNEFHSKMKELIEGLDNEKFKDLEISKNVNGAKHSPSMSHFAKSHDRKLRVSISS